jgi:hypothetical protein
MSFPLAQLLINLRTPPIICGDFTVFATDKVAPPLSRSFGGAPFEGFLPGFTLYHSGLPFESSQIKDTSKLT